METGTIHTIGHSTHSIGDFIAMLTAHGVRLLVDVRSLPRSRFNPQFNDKTLSASLKQAGMDYIHLKALGGRRKPVHPSPNEGLGEGGFRGYADYMQTEDFQAALNELANLADTRPAAIMCAEKDPGNCHRSLVADALAARGLKVLHILPGAAAAPHTMHALARVEGTRVTYPRAGDLFA